MSIVCVGDSLTFGYGLKSSESWVSILGDKIEEKLINKGVPGNTTHQMKGRFTEDVFNHNPSHVFIMGGTNDIFLKKGIRAAYDNIISMAEICKVNSMTCTILTPLPVNENIPVVTWFTDMDYKEVNKSLAQLRALLLRGGAEKSIEVIDLGGILSKSSKIEGHYLNDGIHVSKEVYSEIAEIIYQSKFKK